MNTVTSMLRYSSWHGDIPEVRGEGQISSWPLTWGLMSSVLQTQPCSSRSGQGISPLTWSVRVCMFVYLCGHVGGREGSGVGDSVFVSVVCLCVSVWGWLMHVYFCCYDVAKRMYDRERIERARNASERERERERHTHREIARASDALKRELMQIRAILGDVPV